jgi:hypothetical protein
MPTTTRLTQVRDVAVTAALGIIAAAALMIAMDTDPQPVPTATIPAPSWADGCTTDADCAQWDTSNTGAGEFTRPESCDVTFEGDEASRYPCADHSIESITGPGGDLHHECWVVLTSDEDSLAVCADGTEWPS